MKNCFQRVTAITVIFWIGAGHIALSQTPRSETTAGKTGDENKSSAESPTDVLTPEEWKRVDAAVAKALAWLAAQQQPDGSFPSLETGQPGVTSLCIMAFIAHGHVPGEGEYGAQLQLATDYVLSCQKESGLITLVGFDGPEVSRDVNRHLGTCSAYDHAISSMLLSEVYGMSEPERATRIESAVNKALAATLAMQRWPKDKEADRGGWRYIDDRDESDSDLSLTGWQLMFLRSAPMQVLMCKMSQSMMQSRIFAGAIPKSTPPSNIGSIAKMAAHAPWRAREFSP